MYQTFNNPTRRGTVKQDRVWGTNSKPNMLLTYKFNEDLVKRSSLHKVGVVKEKNAAGVSTSSIGLTKSMQSQNITQRSDNRASITSLIATDVLEETKTRLPNIFNNYFKKTPRSEDKTFSQNLLNRPAANPIHNNLEPRPIVKVNNRFPLKASSLEKLKDSTEIQEDLKFSDTPDQVQTQVQVDSHAQSQKNEEMLIYIRRIDGRAQIVMFSDSDVRPCDLRHPDHSLAYNDVRAYIRENELLSPHSLQRIWIWLADVTNCWQYDTLSKWFSTSDIPPQAIMEST